MRSRATGRGAGASLAYGKKLRARERKSRAFLDTSPLLVCESAVDAGQRWAGSTGLADRDEPMELAVVKCRAVCLAFAEHELISVVGDQVDVDTLGARVEFDALPACHAVRRCETIADLLVGEEHREYVLVHRSGHQTVEAIHGRRFAPTCADYRQHMPAAAGMTRDGLCELVMKDPEFLGGSRTRRRPGGRRSCCDGSPEEVSVGVA